MGGWAGAIRGGLAGLNEAAGNTRIAQNLENINAQSRQKKELPIQQSLAAHQMAIRGLQSKLSTLQEGTPEYNDTVGQIQQNIHAMREIVAPDQKLGAMDWLERHTTDRMHITNHDKRMRQLAARQQEGNSQDQGTAAALAQASPYSNPFADKYHQLVSLGVSPEEALQLATGSAPKTEQEKFIRDYVSQHKGATEEDALKAWTVATTHPHQMTSKEALLDPIYKRMADPNYQPTSRDLQLLQAAGINMKSGDKITVTRLGEIIRENSDGTITVLRGPQKGYEKTATGGGGTWSIVDGPNGPELFNSKTAQTRTAPTGMHAKGWYDKNVAPLDAAETNIKNYLASGTPNGPDDLALQHEFFTATQPATGFRMTKVQQDTLLNARSVWEGMKARVQHTATGILFTPEQRRQISDAALKAIDAKRKALQGNSSGSQSSFGPKVLVYNPKTGKLE